jgi:poly(3-hydroxybutyrate) depolymerase
VFLHGMLPADASPATMQALARAAADEHGFVVLFPRGEQGLCDWDPSVLDWWCWPTARAEVDAHAAAMVDRWQAEADVLAGYLDADLSARYVLGFSNGGYFASYLGLEGWWAPLAGAGVVAAGRSYVDTALLALDRPPFYIAVGALDTPEVQASGENLAYVLALESWPHAFVLHPASGHELSAADFTHAWAAWSSP